MPHPHNKTDPPQTAFLVFLTGKLIYTGAANKEELKKTLKHFYKQLSDKNTIENL